MEKKLANGLDYDKCPQVHSRTDPFVFWMDKVEVVRFLPFLLAVRKIIVSLHAFTKKANKTNILYIA